MYIVYMYVVILLEPSAPIVKNLVKLECKICQCEIIDWQFPINVCTVTTILYNNNNNLFIRFS